MNNGISLADFISQAGIFGFLLIVMATLCVPATVLLVILHKKSAPWFVAVTASLAVLVGYAGRAMGISQANRVLTASAGNASPAELAEVYAIADVPVVMGLIVAATLVGILLLSLLRSLKESKPELLWWGAAMVLCVAMAVRTARLVSANHAITSSQDPALSAAVEQQPLLGSSEHFATVPGPWEEDFNCAAKTEQIGSLIALAIAAMGLAAFMSRRQGKARSAA